MKTVLQANFCCAQVQDGVILIGFATDGFDASEYLLLQKSVNPQAQDMKLGHDQIHLTYRDQAHSAYGGIRKFVLEDGRAEIMLDAKTANLLGTAQHFEIHLPPSGVSLSVLRQHLQQMFGGENGVFAFLEGE